MEFEYQKLIKENKLIIKFLPMEIRLAIMNFKDVEKKKVSNDGEKKNWLRHTDNQICTMLDNHLKILSPNQPIGKGGPKDEKSEQLHPDHYKAGNMDVIAFCHHHDISFCRGNIIKYVTRAGKKKSDNPLKEIEDLKKAKVYLDREIAKLEVKI